MPNPIDSSAAMLRAQQMLQQMRVNYIAELPERIDELEQLTLALKQGDSFEAQFEELYRKTHSLKGTAGTYGMQMISTVCHELEEALERIADAPGKADDQFLDRCIAYFDLMRQVVEGARRGQAAFPEIESALGAMRSDIIGNNISALLVEPSRVNAALYTGMLKGLPVKISIVDSGCSALEMLLRNHFDLLITGYETSALNGLALIAALRLNNGINKDIRAILLTSKKNLVIPSVAQPVTVLERINVSATLVSEVQDFLQKKQ